MKVNLKTVRDTVKSHIPIVKKMVQQFLDWKTNNLSIWSLNEFNACDGKRVSNTFFMSDREFIRGLNAEVIKFSFLKMITARVRSRIDMAFSASRYRQVEQDEAYYQKPQVTVERLLTLERVMREEVQELEKLLG